MSKICVYTCITGNYDNLHEVENPEKNIDYLCFTNNKSLKSKTWKIIYIENGQYDNHALSRKIKMLGHPTISENYNISVWMDASVIWKQSIHKFVSTYLGDKSFAAFKHHARTSVYQESIMCLRLRKDTKENITKTLNFLREESFPDDLGLYEMTVFIKRHNNPVVEKTMQIWFDTFKKFSKRDQLSFMYAVWKTNLTISTINLNVWDNPWFITTKHNPNTFQTTECHVYYGNPDHNFDLNKYHVYVYKRKDNAYTFNTIIPTNTSEIEFNPTNIIGSIFDNIVISPKPTKQTIDGAILSAFCIDHGIIRAYGDYRKGQRLSFSIKLTTPSTAELYQLVENGWRQNNQLLHELAKTNDNVKHLQNDNQKLQEELNKIISSKAWRLAEKARKILHR